MMPVTVLKQFLTFLHRIWLDITCFLFFFCNLNLLVCMTVPVIPVLGHYTSKIEPDWLNDWKNKIFRTVALEITATVYDLIKYPSRSRKRDLKRRLRRCVWNRDSVMEMTRLFWHHWARQKLFWLLTDKVQGLQRQSWWWSDLTLWTATPLITNFERFSVILWGKWTHC